MDSSKILKGAEECSSSESGWTAYIALSEEEAEHFYSEEDESCSVYLQGCKKNAEEEDADSDDSMASDASSGPSDQKHLYRHESKYVGKKHNQQEEMRKKHHEQIKAEKDKSVSAKGK